MMHEDYQLAHCVISYILALAHYDECSKTLADTILGTFTDQERNRSLGQAGTKAFEKYYNDHFIHRDIQNVVLLWPPQARLCRAVAQMNRKWDPQGPKDITDQQRRFTSRHP